MEKLIFPNTKLSPPVPSLKKYFYSYIFIRASNLKDHQHIPTSSCSAIIINHGDAFEVHDHKNNKTTIYPGIYFKGIQLDPVKFGKNISNISLTVILLRPECTSVFLPENANGFVSKITATPDIVRHPQLVKILEFLKTPRKNTQKTKILNEAFEKLILDFRDKPVNDLVSKINHIIIKFQGSIQANDLTTLTEMHIRSLRRKTIEILGISPYQYIKLIRTEFVLSSLLYSKVGNILDIVFEFGFFDQSHLIHDLKKYILQSPLELLNNPENMVIYKKIISSRYFI